MLKLKLDKSVITSVKTDCSIKGLSTEGVNRVNQSISESLERNKRVISQGFEQMKNIMIS